MGITLGRWSLARLAVTGPDGHRRIRGHRTAGVEELGSRTTTARDYPHPRCVGVNRLARGDRCSYVNQEFAALIKSSPYIVGLIL